jgi:hypothetical protein
MSSGTDSEEEVKVPSRSESPSGEIVFDEKPLES